MEIYVPDEKFQAEVKLAFDADRLNHNVLTQCINLTPFMKGLTPRKLRRRRKELKKVKLRLIERGLVTVSTRQERKAFMKSLEPVP